MIQKLPHRFISIEGNIGAGKTTLCELLKERMGSKLILEQFTDNPFLPFFYENQERYAFPVELFFMSERHKQLQEDLAQGELFSDTIISDYYFIKTLLFAKSNLTNEEFRLFKRLFDVLNSTFIEPDLLVYIHRPIEELLASIQKRGRNMEQDISPDYLLKIQNSYLDFFKNQNRLPVLILNVEGMDFKNNPSDFEMLIEAVSEKYPVGTHRKSFIKN